MPDFRIKAGSIHEAFLRSTSKVQLFGGGFANGKTTSVCIKCIQLAKDYPGSNGLIARATYPKLNDTIRAEYMKWLPRDWIKHSDKKNNQLLLINDSVVNFRYVQQQTRGQASGTSNLLSATYDYIAVDQFDDPEFEYKDFTDLLGRLRGMTKYRGDDPHMPRTGPRFMMATLNPTRNWLYRQFIRYVLDHQKTGVLPKPLAEMLEKYEAKDIDSLITLFQGPTDANAHNLDPDYLRTLRATYTGVMADRYIKGDWGAFQGLVYPQFDEYTHMIAEERILNWQLRSGANTYIESFDHGIRSPTCYILFIKDGASNIVAVDGLYERELPPEQAVDRIKAIRRRWGVHRDTSQPIYADPSVFRRNGGEFRTVGKSTAQVYYKDGMGLRMVRGNNDVLAGIIKVRAYLTPHALHQNPFTQSRPAPFLYFNRDRLPWLEEEIVDYYFEEADDDSGGDVPRDVNDHAMDAVKYAMTGVPDIAKVLPKKPQRFNFLDNWTEGPDGDAERGQSHRHR